MTLRRKLSAAEQTQLDKQDQQQQTARKLREQVERFRNTFSLEALQDKLPLLFPTMIQVSLPHHFRTLSEYTYPGWAILADPELLVVLSAFYVALHLIDFSPLRAELGPDYPYFLVDNVWGLTGLISRYPLLPQAVPVPVRHTQHVSVETPHGPVSVWNLHLAVAVSQRGWESQREMAASILGAMGRELYVDDESYLDMVTAVSGSGPAYFFYMVEALTAAAKDVGLPPEVSREIVLQTAVGAAAMLRESGQSATELRKMVASPGGTTAAALSRLEAGGYETLVQQAVRAAYERAKELGG